MRHIAASGNTVITLDDRGLTIIYRAHPTRREVWREIAPLPIQEVFVKPNTMVAVTAEYQGHRYYGYGFAQLNRKPNKETGLRDEWNEKTGYAIAHGRAIKNLLDTIMAAQKEEK